MRGATTAVYILGFAPSKIIQFLLNSYQSFYPGHIFNWTNMVKTSGRCDTPQERIEHLLFVHQTTFLNGQSLCSSDMHSWTVNRLGLFAQRVCKALYGLFQEQMQFLFEWGMSTRVEQPKLLFPSLAWFNLSLWSTLIITNTKVITMIAYCIKSKQHLTILKTDSSGIIGDHNDIGACIMEDAEKENSHQIRLMSQAQEDTAHYALSVEGMLSWTATNLT